jgi:opacity protein-like surface antigen
VVNTGCYLDQPVETSVVNGVPQYQTQPVPNGGCYRVDTETVQTWTGLLNAYGDLGNWFGITPYIGGGIGLTHIRTSASENWFWNNGQSYGPANTYTSATGVAFHYGYLGNVGPSQNLNNFSWALMAGLSYDIAPHLKFDLGYRYLNMGSVTTGNSVRVTVDSQEVRAGLRFTPDL